MNRVCLILLIFLSSSLHAQTAPPMGIRDKTPQLKAFVNARIFVSPDRVLQNATLVIDSGRVVLVGEDITVPEGAMVVDLDGKTIYPGFIDPYTEYGLKNVGDLNPKIEGRKPVYESKRVGATSWNDALHPEKRWVEYFAPDKKALEKLASLGFTTVRSSKMDGVMRGEAFVCHLSEGVPNELVLEADAGQFVSFRKGSSGQQYPSSLMGSIALLRQTFLDADWYAQAQGVCKNNPELAMPEYNNSIESLGNFRSGRFVFDSEDAQTLLRADALASEFSLEATMLGSNREYSWVDLVKTTGRTLILPVDYPRDPLIEGIGDELDITLADLRHWEWAKANPGIMEEHGIPFAFTTYRLKDKSCFLKGIRAALNHGLSREAALAALTTVPARICGIEDETGTLREGKLASFFVCDGNIFEEHTTVYATWATGVKTELVPLDQVDFRGRYRATFNDTQVELVLSGDLDDLEGSFRRDSLEIDLDHVTSKRQTVGFTAKTDKLGYPGLARFSGWMSGDTISGVCIRADRSQTSWQAIKSAPHEIEADSTEVVGPDGLLGRMTHPNLAYGFETLPASEDVLIRNGMVWTCEGDDRPTIQDVLVKDGKFARVGLDLTPPSGTRVIDARGKHVTPGIIDEHSHIACSDDINEWTHAVTPEVRIGDIVNSEDINIYRAVAGGTTIVRSLHGSANPIGGQAQVIKLRWGSPPEQLKYGNAPPSIKWALGENVRQVHWGDEFTVRYPQSRMGVESIMKDALQAAVEYETVLTDYEGMREKDRHKRVPPRRDLILETLLEVIHSRMSITCHAYHQSEMLMLMRLAEEFGFTVGVFTHVLEGYKIADEMAQHGAGAGSAADWWAYKFEVYDAIQHNPFILADHGVTTCVNSDSPELGRRLNQEAAKSVMYCGMDEVEALKMVTINSARLLEIDGYVGSIKSGKDADFVIWNGHPLSIYSRPEQTWIDGCQYFDLARDLAEREEVANERNLLIQKALGVEHDNNHNNNNDGNSYYRQGGTNADH